MRPRSKDGIARVSLLRRVPVRYWRIVALVAVVVLTGLAIGFQGTVLGQEAAGYPAVFLVALVGNASVIFPLPVILALCTAGGVLNPLVVGLVGGAGQSLGEVTAYLAGFGGSGLAQKSRLYQRIHPRVERQGWIVVLVFALIPNPLFDIVGLAAGALRMPLWQFLTLTFAGKTIRSVGLAVACSLGYDLLLPIIRNIAF